MEFHLNYNPTPSDVKITHADKILMIGSCFAENIGEKLSESKFNTLVNPNGILFNPVSIATALHSYIRNDEDIKIGNNNGLSFSLDHHGCFSKPTDKELIHEVLAARKQAHQFLKEAKFLIITFGSAFVYRHIKTNHIVANCHKLPQQDFKKELLKTEDIVSEYSLLIKELKVFNPNLNIIFTVSPVKYLRDGIVENNLSKSILIQSVHELITDHCLLPTATATATTTAYYHYFPAYELVTDDLRDYRFYKEDMAHPNEQAINYVWEKFTKVYFTAETNSLIETIKEITQAALHRPINANTEQHKKFKQTYFQKCNELEKKHPYLNFSSEKLIYS